MKIVKKVKKVVAEKVPSFVKLIQHLMAIPQVAKLAEAASGLLEANTRLSMAKVENEVMETQHAQALIPISAMTAQVEAQIAHTKAQTGFVEAQREYKEMVAKSMALPTQAPEQETEKPRFMKKEFMPKEDAKREIFKAKRHFQAKMAKYAKAKKTFGGAKKVTVSPNGEIRLGKEKLGQVQARTI